MNENESELAPFSHTDFDPLMVEVVNDPADSSKSEESAPPIHIDHLDSLPEVDSLVAEV